MQFYFVFLQALSNFLKGNSLAKPSTVTDNQEKPTLNSTDMRKSPKKVNTSPIKDTKPLSKSRGRGRGRGSKGNANKDIPCIYACVRVIVKF